MTGPADDSVEPDRGRLAAQAGLVLLAAAALLWLVTQQAQRAWYPPADIPVSVAGQHYRVDALTLRWLETFSALHFAEGEDGARELAAIEIDTRLDDVFARVHQRLPAFADWYYSLGGEYTRLGMAALAFVNLAEPGYVATQAAEILFPDGAWDNDLDALERETAARLRAHHADVREGWLAELTRRLAAHRVPTPLPAAGSRDPVAGEVRLDEAIARIGERERAALQTRVGLSTLAAGGTVAGPALWRAAAARSPAAAGRVATRSVGRGAARAGSAAAGATTLCAPAGTAAVACGLVAGAAVWLATDWLLLRLDEHRNREELLEALESGLDALREQIGRELLDGYDRLIAGHYDTIRSDIQRSFVPADAGGRTAAVGEQSD